MNPLDLLLSDPKRLAALATYNAMDTPPDFEQDALTEIAAAICGFPVALISLMDEHRQWFKSNYGLPAITECPVEVSVCSTTICSNDMVYVPDLSRDPRFKAFPTVAGEPHIRACCGMPLINPDGFALGTLCIIDFAPHDLSPAQRESVRRLARQSMALLELRRQLLARDAMLRQLDAAAARLEQACEPGRINISSSTFHHVEGIFETEPRGSIEVKNLGAIEMHFLNRIRPEFSADAEGCFPNEAFWQRAGLSKPQK